MQLKLTEKGMNPKQRKRTQGTVSDRYAIRHRRKQDEQKTILQTNEK